jgi:hypothetical protein
MTTGLSATVLLTDSSIREPKDESPDEEEEALTATALARRPARKRQGRDREHLMGRPRVAVGRRQRVWPDGGIPVAGWNISSPLLSSPATNETSLPSCVWIGRAELCWAGLRNNRQATNEVAFPLLIRPVRIVAAMT